MTDELEITPLEDLKEREIADEVASAIVVMAEVLEPPGLALPFLSEHNWATVPVESALHINEADAKFISNAAQLIGCSECFAVPAEPMENLNYYRVQMTQEGLLEFDDKCSHFAYALVPSDRSFVILCTMHDYYIVAGPRKFVVKALGTSTEAARKAFDEYLNDDFWSEPVRSHFRDVSERYAIFDG